MLRAHPPRRNTARPVRQNASQALRTRLAACRMRKDAVRRQKGQVGHREGDGQQQEDAGVRTHYRWIRANATRTHTRTSAPAGARPRAAIARPLAEKASARTSGAAWIGELSRRLVEIHHLDHAQVVEAPITDITTASTAGKVAGRDHRLQHRQQRKPMKGTPAIGEHHEEHHQRVPRTALVEP